ncbi:unnamed protein product [Anisakis simplex]|uniref:UBX domain-containing protein 4 n=1 Tax=Anisakis simplex TaxID=6269 RepID=A0A0M3K0V9_ANISI|nr:unnamed protein product [Anisakis simplex]
MIKLWDAIDEGFCEETMVAIRIYHGSEQSQQFSQIYPLPIVPSSYIIDLSGQPLDVITINESMDDVVFMSHLRSACEAAHLGDRIKAKNVASSSSSSKQVDSAESGDSKTQRPKEEATELNENSSDAMAAEEKAKRARELLKQKHAAEEERKKKEELEKEMERRNMGKLLSDAKSAREEKEIRELAEKRRRDKIEAEQQLRRLREQIKADREERQRRNAPEANVCGMNKSDENKPLLQQPIPSSECRIQCKFPDGSTLVHQFASSSKFSELIELIKQDGRQKEEFYLVQMYPRREFPDSNSSFLELGLTPSATILVVTVASFCFYSFIQISSKHCTQTDLICTREAHLVWRV